MEEREALRGLKQRDEAALEWFIDRYGAYVHTIIYNMIGRSVPLCDIEEVASDVFFTFWRNAQQVLPGKAKAYLGGVARNKAKEYTRRIGMELSLEDDEILISGDDVACDLERREQARYIRAALMAMGEPEREIFLRYYYFYQPIGEIAAELDMNPSTVKTKLHRGRKKLKELLEKGGYHVEA